MLSRRCTSSRLLGSPRPSRQEGAAKMAHDHRDDCGCRSTARRQLLIGLAALGAAATLPAQTRRAQAASTNGRLIDIHHHYYPPEIISGWQDYITRHNQGQLAPAVAHWTPQSSLDEMDKSGVATSILSLASIPDVWFGLDTPDMRRVARACNDYAATMVRDHPRTLRVLRLLADAGCRWLIEGDRARLRHPESRRHQPVHELW